MYIVRAHEREALVAAYYYISSRLGLRYGDDRLVEFENSG
jgi:hypothetical protein